MSESPSVAVPVTLSSTARPGPCVDCHHTYISQQLALHHTYSLPVLAVIIAITSDVAAEQDHPQEHCLNLLQEISKDKGNLKKFYEAFGKYLKLVSMSMRRTAASSLSSSASTRRRLSMSRPLRRVSNSIHCVFKQHVCRICYTDHITRMPGIQKSIYHPLANPLCRQDSTLLERPKKGFSLSTPSMSTPSTGSRS